MRNEKAPPRPIGFLQYLCLSLDPTLAHLWTERWCADARWVAAYVARLILCVNYRGGGLSKWTQAGRSLTRCITLDAVRLGGP